MCCLPAAIAMDAGRCEGWSDDNKCVKPLHDTREELNIDSCSNQGPN